MSASPPAAPLSPPSSRAASEATFPASSAPAIDAPAPAQGHGEDTDADGLDAVWQDGDGGDSSSEAEGVKPPDLAPRSEAATDFKYIRKHDETHHRWRCRHCNATVITTKQVSLLATHLNGNTTSGVSPCPERPEHQLLLGQGKKQAQEQYSKEAFDALQQKVKHLEALLEAVQSDITELKRKRDEETASTSTKKAAATASTATTSTFAAPGPSTRTRSRAGAKQEDHVPASSGSSVMALSQPPAARIHVPKSTSTTYSNPQVLTMSIRGDGHCGFRVGALALFGDQEEWSRLRTALIQHLEQQGERYQQDKLWNKQEQAELRKHLDSTASLMASRSSWFGGIDCAVLLADFAHAPVIIIDKDEPHNSNIIPPSLASYEGPPASSLAQDFGHLKGRAIVMVYETLHWEYGRRIVGELPPLQKQWKQKVHKKNKDDPRASWIAPLEQLVLEAKRGLDFEPPSKRT